MRYDRVFEEDCENCEEISEYGEQIKQDIRLMGELEPEEREKLFLISRHCPVDKMLESGIEVQSQLSMIHNRGNT